MDSDIQVHLIFGVFGKIQKSILTQSLYIKISQQNDAKCFRQFHNLLSYFPSTSPRISFTSALIYILANFVERSSQTEQFHRLYNFPMGNNSRSPEDYELVAKYRQQQWLHDHTDQGRKISRNRRTKQAVEVIRLHEIPSIDDLDIFTFRMMENDLIKVHHLVIDSRPDLCAVHQVAHLLVQYIPIRLNHIRNFDREEALTILSAAFRAFHLLQIKFGRIQPQQELIGFNEQGKTKVWLNRNSAVNKVQKRVSSEASGQGPMSERVRQLFEMIEQRTRYVMLPPIIKEEIYNPFTTYLSALKVIEKFAYYQKLNLRKYIQLGHQRSTIIATARHQRRPSNFTEYKPSQQICCDRGQSSFCESAVKEPPQFRRIYSVNSIHNPSNNNFHYPIVQPIIRGERQFMIKHSIMSNSSQHQSIRPSSVYFTHSNLPSQSVEQVRSSYLREGPIICKTLETTLENVPKAEVDEHEEEENQEEKVESNSSFKEEEKSQEMRKESVELQQPVLQQHQVSIIDKMNEFIAEQAKNAEKAEKATNTQKETHANQPNSPTFIRVAEPKIEILSFAPSQNNLPQAKKTQQQRDEQRRLSIQNKEHKLEFAPNFQIAPGSILNYCTAVESKLHMATHREHSIIDHKKEELSTPKKQDEKIEQYIREKYGVKQTENKPSLFSRIPVRLPTKHLQKHKPPKLEIPKHLIEHPAQTQDFLDVNFLEKSLDKRYNAEHQQRLEEKKRELEENDALNIAKLEEGLQKFSMSQLSQKNTEQQIRSKESIPKKQESLYEIRLGPQQTSFQSYYPFKEKTINQKHSVYSPNDTDYLRKYEKRSSKYLQGKRPGDYYHAHQDNKHEYSFEDTNKSLHLDSNRPANKALKRQSDFNSIQAKSKKRLQDHSELPSGKTSSPTRRISYNELRQFLWN